MCCSARCTSCKTKRLKLVWFQTNAKGIIQGMLSGSSTVGRYSTGQASKLGWMQVRDEAESEGAGDRRLLQLRQLHDGVVGQLLMAHARTHNHSGGEHCMVERSQSDVCRSKGSVAWCAMACTYEQRKQACVAHPTTQDVQHQSKEELWKRRQEKDGMKSKLKNMQARGLR